MKTRQEIDQLMDCLDETYPEHDICYLTYEKPWQLLFATMLSAQCTDARVNQVTPHLFEKYPDLAAFASANLSELEADIKSTGYYHSKAKHIQTAASQLLSEFGGVLPGDMENLLRLSGVGRKTANLICGHIFNIPSVIVDTHVKRISAKLGLTRHTDPNKIEIDLRAILPKEHWTRYNTQIIAHGRAICLAGNPRCDRCVLFAFCENPSA